MKKKRRRLLIKTFRDTGVDKIVGSFLIFFLIAVLVVWIFEPTITDYFDRFWYCFVSMATIGFGDISATTLIPRIVTVLLWLYAVVVLAIFTAVLTSFFMDAAKLKANESVREFMGELERLPELSKEELTKLSERVKKFNKK